MESHPSTPPRVKATWHHENATCGDVIEAMTQTSNKVIRGRAAKEPAHNENATRGVFLTSILS